MRDPSVRELVELGRTFGVDVDEEEAAELRALVQSHLEGLDRVLQIPRHGPDADVGARTWTEEPAEDDSCNAISVQCTVPPEPANTGVLAGVTVGVKDNVPVAGVPMECGSGVLWGFVPDSDAVVVERLRAAGAAITAKTAMDEFAGGTWGLSYPFEERVGNPHDVDRIPGGSSGGSAAAVTTGAVDVALGTDTGGSIRIPASFCGVVGLKPTYGLVPLTGIVETSYTQDHVGPLSRTVADAARTLEAIAGKDPSDPASMEAAGRDAYRVGGYTDAVGSPPDLSAVDVGVLEEGFGDGVSDEVVSAIEAAVDDIEDGGASVRHLSLDRAEYDEYVNPVKTAISVTEQAAHWRDGGTTYRRPGTTTHAYGTAFGSRTKTASGTLGDYYKSKLLAGAWLIDEHGGRHYARAQEVRDSLHATFEEALSGVDVLALPTTPAVAPRMEDARNPSFDYTRNTRVANVVRNPAISLPVDTSAGLPAGLQLLGRSFGDADLLGTAASVETELGYAADPVA